MQTIVAPTGRVLLINDDAELTQLVTEFLRRKGLEAHVVDGGEVRASNAPGVAC